MALAVGTGEFKEALRGSVLTEVDPEIQKVDSISM
jgi:hypothetical protein